jgi:DNA-binding response OmpR family regulator
MDSNDKTTLVQMRLQPDTLERIDKLSKITNMDNRAELISSAVRITDDMINLLKAGAKLYIEKPDGTKELLKITGI